MSRFLGLAIKDLELKYYATMNDWEGVERWIDEMDAMEPGLEYYILDEEETLSLASIIEEFLFANMEKHVGGE